MPQMIKKPKTSLEFGHELKNTIVTFQNTNFNVTTINGKNKLQVQTAESFDACPAISRPIGWPQKVSCVLSSLSSPNIARLSNFFHRYIL